MPKVTHTGVTVTADDLRKIETVIDRLDHDDQEGALDELQVFADHIVREYRKGQWRPIETCPKDGSCFLIWVHAETHGETDDGLPYVANNSGADIGWWRTGTDPVPYGYVDFGSQNTHDVDEPTYWMPLPAAPEPSP